MIVNLSGRRITANPFDPIALANEKLKLLHAAGPGHQSQFDPKKLPRA
jgi:hypothetical protein